MKPRVCMLRTVHTNPIKFVPLHQKYFQFIKSLSNQAPSSFYTHSTLRRSSVTYRFADYNTSCICVN